MKARWGLVALASALMTLGVVAPAGANAAVEKPSGQALIRVDGGTAYAKKMSKGEYRIVVPDGAEITWMGEVTGKGTRTGTMSSRALVAGWARLGHRDGSSATTTLTYQRAGAQYPTFQMAFLSKPRFNSDGQMTFIARTQLAAALPKQLKEFSINVTMAADSRARSYSVTGPNVYIDKPSSVWVRGVATDVAAGIVNFGFGADSNLCRQGIPLAGSKAYNITSSFPCSTFTVNTKTTDGKGSYVVMAPPQGTSPSSPGQINASFSASPTLGGAPFDIVQTLTSYLRDGTAVAPSIGAEQG